MLRHAPQHVAPGQLCHNYVTASETAKGLLLYQKLDKVDINTPLLCSNIVCQPV